MRQFLEDIVLLCIAYGRIVKATMTGGDVYLAKVLLAEDLDGCGAHQSAFRRLSRVITARPAMSRAYHARAMALLGLERPREALEDFDRALALDPAFPGALRWRASTHAQLGDHAAAAADYLADLRAHPEPHGKFMGVNPQQWAECAQAFVAAGHEDKATELLVEYFAEHETRVTQYRRYETAPMRLLARLLAQSGHRERAAEWRQRALASPHRVPADEH